MSDLRLIVGGVEYAGWKDIRVTRGIEAIAGSFSLSVSERWAGLSQPWPIAAEDECAVILDGQTVITGYVDGRSLAYDKAQHTFAVSGRDKTGALVDCSAVLSKWEFLNVSLFAFAKRICEPFGIKVSRQPWLEEPKPLAKITVDPGDTAFDALERACRMAGILPIADGVGGLVLSRAGTMRATTALVQGKNILAASYDSDATGRYAQYRVSAQHPGTDEAYGPSAAAILGQAQDEGVRRPERVLMVRAEGAATRAWARARAEWEAIVRAARGDSVNVTVQGWIQGDGTLWPVNARVPVRSSYLGIDGEMLITQAVYALDDGAGTTTQLVLKRPDAFAPEPVVGKGGKGEHWKELS